MPAAHHRLRRVRVGEQSGRADRLRHPGQLGDRRDVAEHHPARGQRVGHHVDALPGGEHVEHHPVDGARPDRCRQRLDQVAHDDPPVLRLGAEEGHDVGLRDLGELGPAFERDKGSARPDPAQQPQAQRTGTDPGLDHRRAREDVAEAEDLRRVLRVDDRRAARHRHDEIAEQRAQREVLVAVRRRDHGRVGQADQRVVADHSAMRVEDRTRFQGDRVQAPLRPGELHPVAGAKRSALPALRVHATPARRLVIVDANRATTSVTVRPSSVGQIV